MFKSHFWSSAIISDEGYTVTFLSRDHLRYKEGDLSYDAAYDAAEGQANLVAVLESPETWRNVEVLSDERDRILHNIIRALESTGLSVTLV